MVLNTGPQNASNSVHLLRFGNCAGASLILPGYHVTLKFVRCASYPRRAKTEEHDPETCCCRDDIRTPMFVPQVSVYLVANCKRIRTMLFPGKGDFVTCAFSGDSKWLVAAATEPESNIVVWNWEKEKVRSISVKHKNGARRVKVSPFAVIRLLEFVTRITRAFFPP